MNCAASKTSFKGFAIAKYYFIIIIVVGLLYADTIHLFFYFDDFERFLDVIKGKGDPLFIFKPIVRPGVAYFTPVFYLFFGFWYKVFGLNPIPYHLLNVFTHAVNSCLVCYLMYLLTKKSSLSLIVGSIFSMSFVAVDTIVWPSAIGNLIMALFSILALIFFYKCLETNNSTYYVSSFICFILAISAKVNAISLPLAMLLIEAYYRKDFKSVTIVKYLPFIICIAAYIFLLKAVVPDFDIPSTFDLNRILLNLFKIPLLYIIPEWIIPGSSISYPLIIDMALLSLLTIFYRSEKLIWLGLSLLFVGIAALILVKWEFPVYPNTFGDSIRHRLYLGNLGFSIFLGTLVYNTYSISVSKGINKIIVVSCLSIVVILNFFQLSMIKSEWKKVTTDTENAMQQLNLLVSQLPQEKRNIYIINFPPKQGFGISLQKLFLNVNGLNLGAWPTEIPKDLPSEDLQIYLHLNGKVYDRNSNLQGIAITAWDHFYLSQFLLLMGKKVEATEALKLASNQSLWRDGNIHYYLAKSFYDIGENNIAIEELNKAALNDLRNAEVYSFLGSLYLEAGNYNDAIKSFEASLKFNPADFKIMENLALIYEAIGEVQKARTLFEKALPLENRQDYRRQIKEKLKAP